MVDDGDHWSVTWPGEDNIPPKGMEVVVIAQPHGSWAYIDKCTGAVKFVYLR